LSRFAVAHPYALYFSALGLLIALIMAVFIRQAAEPVLAAMILPLALLPASELALGVVNFFVTWLLSPRVLPKLDFKDGIPIDCAGFVVMPSMLLRPESAEVLLERLEIHYLSNPDPQLRFALLTDFADAPAASMPEDE